MSPADRGKALFNRTAENQKRILDKVQEYESLSPEARELRLRATELRWYLQQLMPVSPTNRVVRLSHIPAELRKPVEDRLRIWDALSPTEQTRWLENQTNVAAIADRPRPLLPFHRTNAQPPQASAELQRWLALPTEERQELLANFNKFFVLTPEERDKTLKSISDPERRQIEKTLKTFEDLPPARRDRCLASLEEFAGLSPQERQEFFQDVERWKEMSPSQRQAWRELVEKLAAQPRLPHPLKRPPTLPVSLRPSQDSLAGADQK
jgi:hypothetical protein